MKRSLNAADNWRCLFFLETPRKTGQSQKQSSTCNPALKMTTIAASLGCHVAPTRRRQKRVTFLNDQAKFQPKSTPQGAKDSQQFCRWQNQLTSYCTISGQETKKCERRNMNYFSLKKKKSEREENRAPSPQKFDNK